jgi:hypothetical protein
MQALAVGEGGVVVLIPGLNHASLPLVAEQKGRSCEDPTMSPLVSKFLANELAPEDQAKVRAHLAKCDPCWRRAKSH